MNNEITLYENIKKRRQELNMSQQELAEAVGYSGKSMVSQVEKGLIDLPSTMITKFSKALNCTEAYLMGWEDHKVNLKDDDTLIELYKENPEVFKRAEHFYELYQKAPREVQEAIETILKSAQPKSE